MELHLSPRVIGKGSKGRTACGSAAYRSCSKIVDNDGIVHDFRNKREYVAGGVELPECAPEDLCDPQTLWQRHEQKDRRQDAQLYRDIEFSVPNELSYSACERIARALAAELTAKGMCVQWDVHDKRTFEFEDENGKCRRIDNPKNKVPGVAYKEVRNLHVHMMVTMRELLPDGTFGNKNRAWNKFNGGLNIADLLRPKAAELMNRELEAIQSDERVDYLSYADRGIDKIPTTHVGVAATAMERKGKDTERGSDRKYIEWLNEIHAENVRAAQKNVRRLDELIRRAEKITETEEVYKEWDALFAYLRDIRRAKSAVANELKKLNKVAFAYAQKDRKYLMWAGCNPDDRAQEITINAMVGSLQMSQKELAEAEKIVLRSKEKIKMHNKVVYASHKVDWDAYQLERNQRGINYYVRRIRSLNKYLSSLRRGVSLLDTIFQTDKFQEYIKKVNEIRCQQDQLWADYAKKRSEIERNRHDLKQHKQNLKQAQKVLKTSKNGCSAPSTDDGDR